MPVFTSTLVSESTRGLTTFHHERLEERNGRERGGHTLDEVDGVLPSPPFQNVAVGGLGDLASASHRRVEPSMSVNKNVTTPEGAASQSADTPAESHNRHAPTWHFAGIRHRLVTKTHSTDNAHRPTPTAHVVVEQVYRRSTSRIPSATVVIPSVPTASVPAPIIVGAIPTTRRSTRPAPRQQRHGPHVEWTWAPR
jgi:hypothetical protein